MINSEETSCDVCGALLPVGATFCVSCGKGSPRKTEINMEHRDEVLSRCPKCGSEARGELNECPVCGVRLLSGAEPGERPVCQNCGETGHQGDNFCAFCGGLLAQTVKVKSFCPRCGARRGKENPCPVCGENFQ